MYCLRTRTSIYRIYSRHAPVHEGKCQDIPDLFTVFDRCITVQWRSHENRQFIEKQLNSGIYRVHVVNGQYHLFTSYVSGIQVALYTVNISKLKN